MLERLRKKLSYDASIPGNMALAAVNSPRLDQLIYRIAKDHQPVCIEELANLSEVTTAYLAASHSEEGRRELPEVSRRALDLLYIGSCFSKATLMTYFNSNLDRFHPGTLLIIKGIYNNSEIKAAWKEIKAHEQVTVTVDLFWIGLVYFRKGQAKEHFKIRF